LWKDNYELKEHSMRRLFTSMMVIALAVTLGASSLWAESFRFKLHESASVNGTTLKPGTYLVELNDQGEALIYEVLLDGRSMIKGKLLVKTRVEVKPLLRGSVTPMSCLMAADGAIKEIRLNKDVVVFVR
ncbi:MAG: hypothetical protein V3U28_04975, partial [Candidatus Acidoferrales bacterium]